ncbi:MAG: acetate--CoA ligase [Flavobacteriia bacterium]|nr:acetate--CoA ligase [Flavobacteriia bacterium]
MRITSFEQYKEVYQESIANPENFWSDIASHFIWKKKWDKVLEWNFDEPKIEWFKGATVNITENIFEKNLPQYENKNAIIWEPNDPKQKNITLTYKELFEKVCQFANGLKSIGIKKGDRVCIYLPMIPELAIAVLACARIGAIHSVVFAGFSANSLSDRIQDAEAKLVITADGLNRGAKEVSLKTIVDEALKICPSVKYTIIFPCLAWEVNFKENHDLWWNDVIKNQNNYCPAEEMDSEDILFILYTSGSTGKPKGVVHTCGGYMVYTAYTFLNVYQYEKDDIYWCTADIGWITGHSYIIYGPLLNAATSVMFEGVPTFPDASRFWQIVDKYKVNQFLTAPTALRSLMAYGEDYVKKQDLSSLKILGTVGEPINAEAWHWYHDVIGKGKCPIVDNWWQTETGGIMITGIGSFSPLKPTFAGYPLPGIEPVLLTPEVKEIQEHDVEGYLCIKSPWPAILRSTYGDHERCRLTYFSHYNGYYFTGDGAKRDENGMYRIIGRIDDVINVSGHRFGTAEIENAINENELVIESAVVGYPHPIKGQSIYAFVVCEHDVLDEFIASKSILETVTKEIGKIALPEKILFVSALPKTRSGKIMRRILRKIAEGDIANLGDTSTLLDPAVVTEIVGKAF